jgi:hypothetical protein
MKNTVGKWARVALGVFTAMILMMVMPGEPGAKRKGKSKIDLPPEMDQDFGELREELQAEAGERLAQAKSEWARRKKEIHEELESERREIIRLFETEQKAIQEVWGKAPPESPIEIYKLDPAYKSEVSYKDGKLTVTSIVVADTPEDVHDANVKAVQHSLVLLDDEVRGLKPTNGPSVAEELKKPDSNLDEKKLDQLVSSASVSPVATVVDLPDGKQGVKVTAEVPMADPEQPSVATVLEPMLPSLEDEAKAAAPKIPRLPPGPPFDKEAWLAQQDPINGVIVDARGSGFEPCIYPRLVTGHGDGGPQVIYYVGSLSDSPAGGLGICGWARSVDSARTEPRLTSGESFQGGPLVLPADDIVQVIENKIVINNTATAKLEASNDRYKYLDQARVVIVVD